MRKYREKEITADFVVVGAGMAGLAAALSAARGGVRTVLVTNRPMLGGSASSEVRVGPGGAEYACFNRNAKETGIVEEIFNHVAYRAANAGKWRWFYFDQIYFDLVFREPNITLILNTEIDAAEVEDGKIVAVAGNQQRSETRFRIKGEIFADCTGDGTLGYLAGNSYMDKMEPKGETGEKYAPEIPRAGTMGASLLFTSVDAGHRVGYTAPPWAIGLDGLPSEYRLKRSIRTMPDGSYYGFWWVEYGGQLDAIADDGEINLHLRKLIYGIWDYIKNSGEYPEADNQELNWIGYYAGKRESRRLKGHTVVNSNDLFGQRRFEDSIGFTGWPVDVHEPEGYLSKGNGYTHYWLDGIADVPLGCLYSDEISNLVFAGRHISATRQALGSLRLISTTAVMGQAIGTAAAMALEKGVTVAQIGQNSVSELQARLLRSDQSIVGMPLRDADDLAKQGEISVSSVNAGDAENAETFFYANTKLGLILPYKSGKRSFSLYLGSAEGEREAVVEVYESDARAENYRPCRLAERYRVPVSKDGWYTFQTDLKRVPGGKIFILIGKDPLLKVYAEKKRYAPVVSIRYPDVAVGREMEFGVLGMNGETPLTICYRSRGAVEYGAEMLQNGFIRPYENSNMWMSGRMGPDGESVRVLFGRRASVRRVQLVFNSDLNGKRLKPVIGRVNPEMVREYCIYALDGEKERLLVWERENFKRFREHVFPPTECSGILLKVKGTWGSDTAELFDIRVYEH